MFNNNLTKTFSSSKLALAIAISGLALIPIIVAVPTSSNVTPITSVQVDLNHTLVQREVYTGSATYYQTGLGACGVINNNAQSIAAVSAELFDSYPGAIPGDTNHNPICNKEIIVLYEGKSVAVTVTDRCEGCAEFDLDLSPAAFETLAELAVGRMEVTWEYA
ncbi:barwin-like endoglucanase [Lentinula aciculospora]|uniref:Barwin-like endoglucanase n=1 Tax=Lentinula aciculospora TaxID=153920 RepID=A0A9W9DI23_9AGAR|nr:barwin-like endoglucanase [Lentinula aciculospora]